MPHKVSAGYRLKEASIQRRCDPVLAAKRLARHLENMRKTYPDYEREYENPSYRSAMIDAGRGRLLR